MSADHLWRPIFAALANENTRRVYAEIVQGSDAAGANLSPSRRRHAIDSLAKAGLIVPRDGSWVSADPFRAALAASAPARRTGIERFLTAEGQIDRYPANLREREELLRHIVARAIEPGEVLSETAVNERLARFSDDVAVLRRYLVDFVLLERTASGSEYARTDQG